jgi:uncharacterized protein (TIGR02246 family)
MKAEVSEKLERLEQRVADLEATMAIIALEGRYARTWDTSDALGWADVFTPDGVFERVDVAGKPGHRKAGRAELARFCREAQAGFGRLHMMHSYDIAVTGDTAAARISFECRRITLGAYPRHGLITGFYDVEYSRTQAGWRISSRRERQVFYREESYFGVQ